MHFSRNTAKRRIVVGSLWFIGSLFLLCCLWLSVWPRFSSGVYILEGKKLSFDGRLWLQSAPKGEIQVVQFLRVARWHPRYYYFGLDNCLESLTVNDSPQTIPDDFCDYHRDNILDIGSVLLAGNNTLRMTVHNGGGPAGVRLRVANGDPMRLMLFALFITIVTTYFLFLFRHFGTRGRLVMIVLLAALLRLIYMYVTPHPVRTNDASGHMAYIRFIASHWTIPDDSDGWQYYQPPIYYFISALLMKAGWMLRFNDHIVMLSLQTLSFVFSLGVLGTILWIGSLLFKRQHKNRLLYFFSIPAVLPALIFFSARINNDVLVSLFSILALAFLLRWWHRHDVTSWLFFCLLLGLGSATKGNMLLLLPVGFVCLVAAEHVSWKKKLLLSGVLAVILLVFGGWYYIPRLLTEADKRSVIVGNIDRMTGAIPHRLRDFIVFNPLAILRYPFNDPVGIEARRSYLWEYFFRTALYSEYPFEFKYVLSALLMISSAMYLLLVFLWNLVADMGRWTKSPSFPLWVTFFFHIIGLLALRYFSPFSCSADFRYITAILVPIAYYAVVTPRSLPPFITQARDAFIIIFCASSFSFLLLLLLFPD